MILGGCLSDTGVTVRLVGRQPLDADLVAELAVIGPRIGADVAGVFTPAEIGGDDRGDVIFEVARPAVGLGEGKPVAGFLEDEVGSIKVGSKGDGAHSDACSAAGWGGAFRSEEVVGLPGGAG